MKPLVSIAMPVFNNERTIKATISSILNQTYSSWELLLMDDGSTDKTLQIAENFQDHRIKIIKANRPKNTPQFSIAANLNRAICLSKGKYFARMDGDDIAYPERLQAQVEYLESHPDVDLVGTKVVVFDQHAHARGSYSIGESHAEICNRPWSGFYLTHPTWMGKKEWFALHQYQEKTIRAEDFEFLLRTHQTSKFACVPEILLGYRVESFSLRKSLIGRYQFSLALLEKAFREKNYLWFLGVVEQITKALVDIFASTTGLNFKILRHRVGNQMNATELTRWQEVWTSCNS